MPTEQDHLNTLADELKAAAQKYTAATGKGFSASFEFVDSTNLGGFSSEIIVGRVQVESPFVATA